MSGFGNTTVEMKQTSAYSFPAQTNFTPGSCEYYKYLELSVDHDENLYKDIYGMLIIRTTLASLVLVVNSIGVVALIKSWGKFRQNIYIFALNILICDAILGLVNLANSFEHLIAGNHKEGESYRLETAWFYSIKAAIFMSTEIATIGNTALIALAFNRYVSAQLYQHNDDNARLPAGKNRRTSILLSRRTSKWLSCFVWIVTIVFFFVGLFLNCTGKCSCFLREGILIRNSGSALCHYNQACSFYLPSINSYYAIVTVMLFLICLIIILIFCIRTIYLCGGCAAILPYRLHLILIRKSIERHAMETSNATPQSTSLWRRKNSMQLAYLRNMTHFIFSITAINIVFRLPDNILLLAESFSKSLMVNVRVADMLDLIASVNALINPFVYYFTLHRMKQAIHDVFEVCCVQTIEVRRGDQAFNFQGNNSLSLDRVQRTSMNKSVKIVVSEALPPQPQ